MGIDIYAEWDGMTEAEKAAQITGFSIEHGHVGYLREAHHGEPYATKVLVPEAFEELRVRIYADTLRDRKERHRSVAGAVHYLPQVCAEDVPEEDDRDCD